MRILDNAETTLKFNEIILVLAIILFAGLVRIPSLTQPLGPDQGIMSVIGEGILQGKLPYRDYWEMGSPAIFFTYAAMFKVFGTSMTAIPITDTLVSLLTTLLVYLTARSIWNNTTGYVSALLFAFFSNGIRLGMHAGGDIAFGTFWYIAQRETFMLPFIVAGIYFLLRSERGKGRFWYLSLSGFLVGWAFVYKFPAALIFLSILFYVNGSFLIARERNPWKALLIRNIALISGFILALLPFTVLFWLKGALHEMVDVIFGYVFSVYGQLEHNYLGIIKMALIRTLFIAKENFILWLFFITSSLYILINERIKEHLLLVVWGLASVLFIASHREFFGYHYLLALPPFSLLAGYGIVKALGPKFNPRGVFTAEYGKAFIIFAILANLVFFATLNYMHYTKFYYYATDKITREEYYRFFNAYPKHDYSFPADYRVAQYIVNHTDTGDMIYALGGIESVIYFLTKRQSPSRFIFSWIIFSDTHGRGKQAEAYRRELLVDLQTKRPKYIVAVRSLETFRPFSDIYHFIKSNYTLEQVFPDDRFVYVANQYERAKV